MHSNHSTTLNEKYFSTIHTEKQGDREYQVVRPKDHPMILFSKVDGTPLASLHLRCQSNHIQNEVKGNHGKALLTKRPYNSPYVNCQFQGLVDRDHQEFELVISNLNETGHINFNILKTDSKVETVNPGGLNEINELRPGESYAVQCDQSDNKVLVLNTITTEGGGKMTVEQDEDLHKKPSGAYYFLSVVPQIDCPEMVERFAKTEWACVDVFCRSVKTAQAPRWLPQPMPYRNCWGGYSTRYTDNMPTQRSGSNDMYRMMTTPLGGGPQMANAKSAMTNDIDSFLERGERLEFQSAEAAPGKEDSSGVQLSSELINSELSSASQKTNPLRSCFCAVQYLGEEEEEEADFGGGGLFCSDSDDDVDDEWADPVSPIKQRKMRTKESSAQPKQLIKDSLASKVGAGDRTVHVQSAQTNIEYSYDLTSEPCVIGLSVSDKLVFGDEPNIEELVQMGKQLMQDIIQNGAKKFLENLEKVYKSDTCGICLSGIEEGEPVDCVFYQCGHQNTHYECSETLDKCPLCRCWITAKIKV